MKGIRIVPIAGNALEFYSPYSASLVAALKSEVPADGRRWDGTKKAWIIADKYGHRLADAVEQATGTRPTIPAAVTPGPTRTTRLVDMRYLGAAKDRGSTEPIAFGFADGNWTLAFPLSVLKRWFADDSPADVQAAVTLYGVLGIARDTSAEDIKKAYRRAARTYHPDVNHEPDAADQFRRIQQAYEVLADPNKKARYDAGLVLEASLTHDRLADQTSFFKSYNVWRPPVRCGYLLVEGTMALGRLNVERIIQWQDITNDQDQVLVTSWKMGDDTFTENWM